MKFEEIMQQEKVDFSGIDASLFLLGLLSAFDNRYQAKADSFFEEISWKQFFAIICIKMCKESPTINELAEIMGSSHQNVKQILLKLEKKDFVKIIIDKDDKRKQRILLTEHCKEFCQKNDAMSQAIMESLFYQISPEQLQTTIKTIIQVEDNLKKLEGE